MESYIENLGKMTGRLFVLEDGLDVFSLESEQVLLALKNAFSASRVNGERKDPFDLVLGKKPYSDFDVPEELYEIPFFLSSSREESMEKIARELILNGGREKFFCKDPSVVKPYLYLKDKNKGNRVVPSEYYTTNLARLKQNILEEELVRVLKYKF